MYIIYNTYKCLAIIVITAGMVISWMLHVWQLLVLFQCVHVHICAAKVTRSHLLASSHYQLPTVRYINATGSPDK